MHFGCKNKQLVYLLILSATFLLENDYNLVFSLEMDPIDEGNNNNSESDNDNNDIPLLPEHRVTEEQLALMGCTIVFLFVIFSFIVVPVKFCVLMSISGLTLFKIIGFIVFLFLSCILDSSYFNMCYLSEQDVNLTEIWLNGFNQEEEVFIEDDNEELDFMDELDTDDFLDDIAFAIGITIIFLLFGSVVTSVLDY